MSKISLNSTDIIINREWERAREQVQSILNSLNEPCMAVDVSISMDTADYLTNLFSNTTVANCDFLMVHRDDDTMVGSTDNGVTWVDLFQSATPQTIQTGMIMEFGGKYNEVPDGYLICDGQAVSRTTYATLFALIGTDFGNGDGSTTFNVPDMRARSPMNENDGVGNSLTVRSINDSTGAESVAIVESELATHDHTLMYSGFRGSGNSGLNGRLTGVGNSGNYGGDGAHDNIPPAYFIHYIIKT